MAEKIISVAFLLVNCPGTVNVTVFSCKSSSHQVSDSFSSSSSYNTWTSLETWNNSWPSPRYGARAEAIKIVHNGFTDDAVVLTGGQYSRHAHRTWIYNVHHNSWRPSFSDNVPRHNCLSAKQNYTMISLCKEIVMIYCLNGQAWLFEIGSYSWRQVQFVEDSLEPLPRRSHSAVAVRDSSGRCKCQESMLVFGGIVSTTSNSKEKTILGDLWELQCVEEGVLYRWTERVANKGQTKCETWPQPRYDHLAISAFENTMMYIYGGENDDSSQGESLRNLLAYNVTSNFWNEISSSLQDQYKIHSGLTGVFVDNPEAMLVFCCQQPIIAYNLIQEYWFEILQITFNQKLPHILSPAVAVFGSAIAIFGGRAGSLAMPTDDVWYLRLISNRTACWFLMTKPVLTPLWGRKNIVADIASNGELIAAFGGVTGGHFSTFLGLNDMWVLNVTTMRWSSCFQFPTKMAPVGAKGVVLSESIFIVFGGCYYTCWCSTFGNTTKIPECSNTTFAYFLKFDEWRSYKPENATVAPIGRRYHTLVKRNELEMILFGGTIYGHGYRRFSLADLWRLNVNSNGTLFTWTAVRPLWRSGGLPLPVFGHAATVFDSRMFVYGGSVNRTDHNNKIACNRTFWEYKFGDNIWKDVTVVGVRTPGNRCYHFMATYGRHIILTAGCSSVTAASKIETNAGEYVFPRGDGGYCEFVTEDMKGVWAFSVDNGKWMKLSDQTLPRNQELYPSFIIRKGTLIALGGSVKKNPGLENIPPAGGFSFMRLGCPKGHFSRDFPSSPCQACSIGTFSEISSSPNCTPCPLGLTTDSVGKREISECSVCVDHHCGYGSCRGVLPGPQAYCECNFGFTKNDKGQCAMATYYIAGSSAIAGVAVILLMVVAVVRLCSAQREQKRNIERKEQELDDLTNAWVVDPFELVMHDRIDQDSPGGFGEVYRAEYREMTVAVKRLQELQRIERNELEFEREIEVMRSIRHRNIVMFIGRGTFRDDGSQFLVIEYMPRGSLHSMLRNFDYIIETTSKLSFALDVARGMEFLHNLKPPRIHRDLKSGNCLVSNRYVVKVADFGSARLVKTERCLQTAVRGCGPLSLSQPLLEPEYELTTAIGTRQWTAPEVFRGDDYGTPVDVYR